MNERHDSRLKKTKINDVRREKNASGYLEPGSRAQCFVAPRSREVRHAEEPSRWMSETRAAEAQIEAG